MALAMGMGMGSSSSATVAVDKATCDLLIGPDWTMNIDICDSVNSHHWQAKDVVKALKKRLQHKSPKVQLLALTLLETMVKNCGDYVHFQIAEKNVLGEMVKIIKKKTDMHVRDKILALLDSWQEAFGGPGGKHPQYYWVYEELRRAGVKFPQRSLDAAPIFTPPATNPTLRLTQPGYGMPSNSSRRLDETMAAEIEGLSLSGLDSMWDVMELLNDMLQANPGDCEDIKDEVIVDLVDRCRSNQKKLMQMLTTTGDEELLGKGLELNDSMQILLAKHDAFASGSPMPTQVTSLCAKPSEGRSSDIKPTEARDASPRSTINSTAPAPNMTRSAIDEEDEEEDDFAQLARRHSKTRSVSSQSSCGTNGALVPLDAGVLIASTSSPCNAMALPDPPAPVRTMKEQDVINILSLTLSTTSTSPYTPPVSKTMPQIHVSSNTQGYPYVSQTYPVNSGPIPYNSYVIPCAERQTQLHQLRPPSQPQLQHQAQQHQLQPPSQPPQQLQPRPQQPTGPQIHVSSNTQNNGPIPYNSHVVPWAEHQAQLRQLRPPSQPQLQHQAQQHQLQPPSRPPQQLQPRPQQPSGTQIHVSSNTQNNGPIPYSSYVVPWAERQAQLRQLRPPSQPLQQLQPQPQQPSVPQPQPHLQPQFQSQHSWYSSSGYPPPPWEATTGYLDNC
ncbi:hypothetical protein OIU78_003078 [Salix suchowensis]|nr:hypothetical protein OIU78_003078 [Salix suchowensis]